VIMPTFGAIATRLTREHDVLSLHLPQFDAWGLALRGRLMKKPVVLTYHCDLLLPAGPFNRVVNTVVDVANDLAGRWSDAITSYTDDFAANSPYLQRFKHKLHIIPPPVELPAVTEQDVATFRERFAMNGGPIIGMVARLATEKGVEMLLQALPQILERYPDARGVLAGPYQNVMGEEAYAARLQPLIERMGRHWQFTGLLAPHEVAAFMHNCACLTVPSLNSTESFGIVQIESMLCGTPVVSSNLPGVRQPVRMTGMGEVVPVGDAPALAAALLKIIDNRTAYIRPPADIAARFSPDAVAAQFEQLFQQLIERKAAAPA
jgi:glycosyltransferase involved in cell wall biosynthesis